MDHLFIVDLDRSAMIQVYLFQEHAPSDYVVGGCSATSSPRASGRERGAPSYRLVGLGVRCPWFIRPSRKWSTGIWHWLVLSRKIDLWQTGRCPRIRRGEL